MSEQVQQLLEQAEAMLYRGIEHENGVGIIADNVEKYERARALFEQILELDPDNRRARDGLAACEEMLTPIIPVQCIAPIAPAGLELPETVDAGAATSPPETTIPPWEARRRQREYDRKAMQFTGEVFSHACSEATAKAQAIIDAVLQQSTADPMAVLAATIPKILELQAEQSQAWKGHGRDIQETAIRRLLDGLGLVAAEKQAAAELADRIQALDEADPDEPVRLVEAHEKRWGLRHDELLP